MLWKLSLDWSYLRRTFFNETSKAHILVITPGIYSEISKGKTVDSFWTYTKIKQKLWKLDKMMLKLHVLDIWFTVAVLWPRHHAYTIDILSLYLAIIGEGLPIVFIETKGTKLTRSFFFFLACLLCLTAEQIPPPNPYPRTSLRGKRYVTFFLAIFNFAT